MMGNTKNEAQANVIRAMQEMTDEQQHQFLRMVILLRNGSPRVQRLADMAVKGQISQRNLLDMV